MALKKQFQNMSALSFHILKAVPLLIFYAVDKIAESIFCRFTTRLCET